MVAAALAGIATGAFSWRLSRLDAGGPQRLVAQLRLAQWAAILLAATGAVPIGLAVGQEMLEGGTVEISFGMTFILLSAMVLTREPREALLVVAAGFGLHALLDIAHRPGWLSPYLMPRWFAIGCAIFDVYIAAVCYWARRR
jgi:uncharacterized membrane protein HdeD (DUF308 family)